MIEGSRHAPLYLPAVIGCDGIGKCLETIAVVTFENFCHDVRGGVTSEVGAQISKTDFAMRRRPRVDEPRVDAGKLFCRPRACGCQVERWRRRRRDGKKWAYYGRAFGSGGEQAVDVILQT